ncbi:hypothetical protein FACS1894188_07170 [Clostridia bacterium]|nr:hypothetical protein FACS1894188_07170 [Clostridia bacterium]
MSHFSVLVITSEKNNYADALAPFDNTLEFPRYIEATREQLIAKKKNWFREYTEDADGAYQTWLRNPAEYESKRGVSANHIDFLRNVIPQMVDYADDEWYNEAIRFYDENEIGENGEVYSTCNPNGHWSWYVVGGKFSGWLTTAVGSVNCTQLKDVLNIEDVSGYAYITNEGEWIACGKVLAFGFGTETEESVEQYDVGFREYLKTCTPDDWLTVVDCHN